MLDILYTDGGGQTQQAVISGSVDIGIGVGTYGVLGAFSKGAPVRVIGNSMDGAHDLYWYVRADSPIKTMKDAAGKTVAYSTTGSSTALVVQGLERTLGVKLQGTATGSPPATFTQVMSGQIDVGWSSPPFALDAVDGGAHADRGARQRRAGVRRPDRAGDDRQRQPSLPGAPMW